MCGVAGIYLKDPNFEVDLDAILDTMLLGIEPRGDDATGFVAIGSDGLMEWQKASCSASTFIAYRRSVPTGTRAILGHTRWATQGLPAFIENNHPIRRGPFFIIHNGHVKNDDDLFVSAERARFGQVDSEAIAARLASFGDLSKLQAVMEEIKGDAAVAAVDERDASRLVMAKGNYSPLYVYDGRRIVLFASTRETVRKAHEKHIGSLSSSGIEMLVSGEQLEWRDGDLIRSRFTPVAPEPVVFKSVSTTSGFSWDEWDDKEWWRKYQGGERSKALDAVKKDYGCDNCSAELYWSQVFTRYDPEEKLTFMFCDDCVELWDWDQFGGDARITFLPDNDDILKDVEEMTAEGEIVEGDASEIYDDYDEANRSIIRDLRNRLF